jgi:hypothetical protein
MTRFVTHDFALLPNRHMLRGLWLLGQVARAAKAKVVIG